MNTINNFNPIILTTYDKSNSERLEISFSHNANSIVSKESGTNISYHPSLSDVQNGIKNLISLHTSAEGTVFIRVERISTKCYNTVIITLEVGIKCIEYCTNGIDYNGDGLIDCLFEMKLIALVVKFRYQFWMN